MRYFVKLNKGYPVPGSLVYNTQQPTKGKWMEIFHLCRDEDSVCQPTPKPDGYFQKLKFYYIVDECCLPIAGSNINAFCHPPTGNYFEYFPPCLIKPCIFTSTISILQAIKCHGDLAQIEVTATHGVPPYTGTGIFNVPASGSYSVEVTDSAGNIAIQTPIVISQPSQLTVDDITYDPILEEGDTTSLNITASGGVGPYTYSLDGITYGPSPITNVGTGTYTVYVKDANDCIATAPLVISIYVPDFPICPDCSPVLNNVTDHVIGKLSVGNMTSSTCTVGDYVIDWYLNNVSGSIEFTSGNTGNTDPAIQQFHPFTGTNARPSAGGSWIPVIRYAYFDSIKYTSVQTPGSAFASDLAECLDPVIVDNYNCGNGTMVGTDYTHLIEYQPLSYNPSDSSRTFYFDLGASINYFAWKFYGYSVSDKIQFYYVSGATETSLGKYAVGLDVSTNFTGEVKTIYGTYFKEVFDISSIPFVSGDYIKIVITSSYADPNNQNTNWRLECKCLETFNCTFAQPSVIDPCTSVMTWNDTECRYELTYNYSSFPNISTNDSLKYLLDYTINPYGDIRHTPTFAEPYTTFYMPYGQYCTKVTLSPAACVNGQLKTLTKVGSVYTISFTNEAEYLIWKNQYSSYYTNIMFNYDTSPSNVNHFKFFTTQFIIDQGLLGCGDNKTYINITYHASSVVSFDDAAFIMEIDVTNTTNELPPLCAGSCSNITEISLTATTISTPDFGPTSSTVRPSNQGFSYYNINNVSNDTASITSNYDHYLPYGSTNYVCEGTDKFCVSTFANYSMISFHSYADVIKITDMTDGVNNYKIQRALDANGCLITDPNNYITVFEISNGVIITPDSHCCLNTNYSLENNLNGWTIINLANLQPGNTWRWSSAYGGSANYIWDDSGGALEQNILTVGKTYHITFTYYIVNNTDNSNIYVKAGNASSGFLTNTNGTHNVDITLTCTNNTKFQIRANNDGSITDPTILFVNNICVTEVI